MPELITPPNEYADTPKAVGRKEVGAPRNGIESVYFGLVVVAASFLVALAL